MEIKKNNRRDYDKGPRQHRDYAGKDRKSTRGAGERPAKRFTRTEDDGNEQGGRFSRAAENRPAKRFSRGAEDRPAKRFSRGAEDRPAKRFARPYDEEKTARTGRFSRGAEGRPSSRPGSSAEGRPAKRFARGDEDRPARHFTRRNDEQQAPRSGFPRSGGSKPFPGKPARKSESVTPSPKTEVRLNKFIANSGICSRREADRLIESGAVTVNGKSVTELGTKIDIRKDVVLFGDQRLHGEDKVYIVMNKPKGFVTTTSDPHAEQTVMDLLTKCPARVFPVGRLDKNTTGVLMFTNDGELSEKLTHPSYNKKKIYEVTLDRKLDSSDAEKILSGIELEDGMIKADELDYVNAEDLRKIGIEIHSGRNRIVRRIFEALGYTVKGLDRVYFAGITKKGMKRGQWRYLTEGEVNILKMGAFN